MQQGTITLVVAVAGIAGTFGSGYFSQRMAQKSQREQWLLDQRKEEFREIIIALADSLKAEADHSIRTDQYTPDERRKMSRKSRNVFELIQTRIFTADDVKKIDLHERWSEAISDYRRESDGEVLKLRYESLIEALVAAAKTPPPKAQR